MSYHKKGFKEQLTEQDLAEILEHWNNESEDDFDFSDTNSIMDPDYVHDENANESNDSDLDGDVALQPILSKAVDRCGNENSLVENEEAFTGDPEEAVDPIRPTASKSSNKSKVRENILWRKKNLIIDDDAKKFKGNAVLPQNILDLDTPYDFFKYFFNDELIGMIINETNLYSVQKNSNHPANITAKDLEKFLGICIYMSVSKLPRTRCYWRPDIGISSIRNAMSINEFERMKGIIHFNDNNKMLKRENPRYDNLHKIRPLLTHLTKQFSSIPMESKLSVDEQICSTKSRHHLKQYNPMKPHKWGFKVFMLCDTSGFSYNFEIYNGSSNYYTRLNSDESDLGASGNVVVRLARIIPKNMNYQLYCDNYYTSIPLFTCLTNKGIYMLGTIRRNRIPCNKLTDEKKFKKFPRGTSEEFVAHVSGVDLSIVSWNDNKTVTLLSSCFGELPHHPVKRFSRKEKKNITIACPNVIKQYNIHMGGVDMLDSYVGRHKIGIRSKKWYMRLFYHLLDITVINSWLLSKRAKKQKGDVADEQTLWQYRLELAQTLCLIHSEPNKKRGRPSNEVELGIDAKRHKGPAVHAPPKNVRMDQVAHWIQYKEARQRCKMPDCKGFTHFKCEKCGVHLCLTKDKNCFHKFHLN